MRLNDEKEQAALRQTQENRIRAIVREEIAKAFQAFRREAERYDGGEIRDMAADALSSVLDGTVIRLTCPHEKYRNWGFGSQPQCARCGEPEPELVNPFEEHQHTFDFDTGNQPTDCIECGAPYPGKEKSDG